MLTYFELPAVYVNPDTGFVFALDHVLASLENGALVLENPTDHDAVYRVFSEKNHERAKPLSETFMLGYKEISVPAHSYSSVELN